MLKELDRISVNCRIFSVIAIVCGVAILLAALAEDPNASHRLNLVQLALRGSF